MKLELTPRQLSAMEAAFDIFEQHIDDLYTDAYKADLLHIEKIRQKIRKLRGETKKRITTTQLLNALDELERKATEAPWNIGYSDGSGKYKEDEETFCLSNEESEGILHAKYSKNKHDSELIVAIRNAWPDISATIKSQAEEIESFHIASVDNLRLQCDFSSKADYWQAVASTAKSKLTALKADNEKLTKELQESRDNYAGCIIDLDHFEKEENPKLKELLAELEEKLIHYETDALHTCHANCKRHTCVIMREKEALKARVAELDAETKVMSIYKFQHAKLLEVVRFYANRTNWGNPSYSPHSVEDTIHFTDITKDNDDHSGETYGCGGKIARAVLKEFGL